jgi:pyrimidine deaminase RibD-like protein
MTSGSSEHLAFMKVALDEAEKCIPTPTAFCVGCVIVVPIRSATGVEEKVILSTGYSRELVGNTHAEANALAKGPRTQFSRARENSSQKGYHQTGVSDGCWRRLTCTRL